MIRLHGASFETLDDVELNTYHERLNVLWRNLASEHVTLWTHMVRRREDPGEPSGSDGSFAGALRSKYLRSIGGEALFVNELYLAIVYRSTAGSAAGFAAALMTRSTREEADLELKDALEACERLRATTIAGLDRYVPEPLGLYQREGRTFSRPCEFLASLINAASGPVPLASTSLDGAMGTGRLLSEMRRWSTGALRKPASGRCWPSRSTRVLRRRGLLNALLSAPISLVLTQSFSFIGKAAAQGLMRRQINRMSNAGDYARSQTADLEHALDALTSNEFVLGDHHLSLQVLTRTCACDG